MYFTMFSTKFLKLERDIIKVSLTTDKCIMHCVHDAISA